jgi:hypothetical protein
MMVRGVCGLDLFERRFREISGKPQISFEHKDTKDL